MLGGYLKDPHDARDALFAWKERPFRSVPIEKAVNLWLPSMSIVTQAYSSCTGMAGAYALQSAIAHHSGKDPGVLSGAYLYYTGRAVWGGQDEDEGSYLRTLFDAIEIQGACKEELFTNATSPFKSPGWSQVKNGFKHRGIKNYRQIYTPDEAREALSEGIPLVGGWTVGDDFVNWNGGAAFTTETAPLGGHALAIMGYNINGDFLVPNSWGTSRGEAGWWRVSEQFLMSTDRLFACDTKEAA